MPDRLTAHDASFLYTETPTGPMHGASVAIFDGEMSFKDALEFTESRIHLVTRYRQRLALVPYNLNHPTWEDDPAFDIRNHVQHVALAPRTTLEEGLKAAVDLAEPLLDRTRPMWKTVVLTGVPDRTLLLSMVHHCMIDGASGIELSQVMMDFEPEAPPPPPPDKPWAPPPLPSEAELLASASRDLALQQFENLFRASNLVADPARAARRAFQLGRAAAATANSPDRPVVTAPWNLGPVSRRRTLAWRRYPFALIRALRTELGGTVNDVVLTIISEAAARYIRGQGYDTSGRYVRIMCPVNIRKEGEAGARALGNQVSGMFPVLPSWPMPVVERHEFVKTEMATRKAAGEAQAIQMLMEESSSAPPSAMAVALLQGMGPDLGRDSFVPPVTRPPQLPPLAGGFNFTVSNLPGVQVAQYMAGHRLLDSVGTIMLGGTLGFGAVVSTYNQNLYISLTGEPRLLPDIEAMAVLVDTVLQEMTEAAHVARVPATATVT